jgi:Protein of unknown function (DUF3295)
MGEFRCTAKAIYRITDEGIRTARWDTTRTASSRDSPSSSTANLSGGNPQVIIVFRCQDSWTNLPRREAQRILHRGNHPWNLPASAPPTTPRTTRWQMLATELSESLRSQCTLNIL